MTSWCLHRARQRPGGIRAPASGAVERLVSFQSRASSERSPHASRSAGRLCDLPTRTASPAIAAHRALPVAVGRQRCWAVRQARDVGFGGRSKIGLEPHAPAWRRNGVLEQERLLEPAERMAELEPPEYLAQP